MLLIHFQTTTLSQFVAPHSKDWLKRAGIQPLLIYPGSPWENGYNERFNGTLRREMLNAEWFHNTKPGQVAINAWLRQYNQIRPRHALGMRPTVPETLLEKARISGTEKWGQATSYGEIKRVYVDPAYRGKAIASKLMTEIEQTTDR